MNSLTMGNALVRVYVLNSRKTSNWSSHLYGVSTASKMQTRVQVINTSVVSQLGSLKSAKDKLLLQCNIVQLDCQSQNNWELMAQVLENTLSPQFRL